MRFDRLRLENFKCFETADVEFDAGVTVIHGLNGSGKSSLLEAAFFALYGARALRKTLDEVVTIGEKETRVELWFTHAGRSYLVERRLRVRESGTQTVDCVLDGPEETIEGATDVRARIAELLRMDEEAFLNCAYVRQGEVNKLIEASPGERQDMIDDLLQLGKLEEYRDRASDARVGVGRVRNDKQGALKQFDDQIEAKEDKDLHAQLNETESNLAAIESDIEGYEEQREAAVDARDRAAEILETYEEKREELAQVEADVADLREAIQTTATEREELASQIESRRERREGLVEQRDKLLSEIDVETETTAEGAGAVAAKEAAEPGETVEAEVASAEGGSMDRDTLAAHLETLEAEVETLRERNLELVEAKNDHESTAEAAREAAADLDERAADKREQAGDLETAVEEDRERLAERRDGLEERAETIQSLEATFDDAPVAEGAAADWHEELTSQVGDLREEIANLEATLENQRASLEEARALREAGKCPTCGQDVEGAPHVDTIDEDEAHVEELEATLADLEDEREELAARRDRAETLRDTEQKLDRLRDERENLSDLLERETANVEEKAERVETLREDAGELAAEAETKREEAAAAEAEVETICEEIGEVNSEQSTLRERIERGEALLDTWSAIEQVEREIERRQERRVQLAETNDERRERLAEKRERKAELAEELEAATVEEARAEKETAEEYIQKADVELEALREERDALQERIGAIRNEIEELETLREHREEVAATLGRLDSLYEEASDLEEMYGTLRAELRQRNVETLERMLNESFELVYENDSYSRIELDGQYRLTVYQKDGEPLAPDQLSGGERALFNLSLRSAIYRLLAEGIEGAAPMPPLILDEPTVFLDAGHVSKLVDLIDHMRDIGVEQLLLVSHDEELVAAADDLVAVEKDATTNRSTVERVDAASPVPAPGGS
ncbi:MAG: DNA double-strand break repair ATPase Rad50 [Haloarculaceae archaeon]